MVILLEHVSTIANFQVLTDKEILMQFFKYQIHNM